MRFDVAFNIFYVALNWRIKEKKQNENKCNERDDRARVLGGMCAREKERDVATKHFERKQKLSSPYRKNANINISLLNEMKLDDFVVEQA